MNKEKVGNLKIAGSGSAGGGVYDEVRIAGSGEITGNVECSEFHISGSGSVDGNVKTSDFMCSGSSHVNGNLESEYIKTSGSSHITGDVKAKETRVAGSAHIEKSLSGGEVSISGSVQIDGSLRAEHVEVSGGINIKGDCETEEFSARGAFQIGGLLNAGKIDIGLVSFCSAKEIGGELIEVRELAHTEIWNRIIGMFSGRSFGLTTNAIEGDDIYLEYTKAKIVRGYNITIGKGCVIDTVEYKDKLNVIDGGKVGNEVKLT